MAGLRATKEKGYYWDRTQTLMLIELYRQNPCLWNAKSDVYKDRNTRAVAINGITAKLQGSGSHVSAVEVKRKIEIIRSQYRRELRKLEKSKKLGAEADDTYTPALWFFDELCFLKDGVSMRELMSNMDSQVSHTSKEVSDHEIFNGILLQQPEDIAPSRTTPPPGTRVPSTSREIVQSAIPEPSRNQHLTKRLIRRSTAVDEQHEVLQEALHQLRNFSRPEESENDDESDFGRVVTNDLRKMNEENKVHAQKLISEVLYIGKLGKLSSSMMIVE
ncbi:uncharacterized protein LOC135195826 isoform X1 [Macrobrachium nipponense]|uniref:uncharacterized protein LOC135195826 isoform X1 n=1 Tax=Macrobrachium nipponense TaxID=159736 RepID=UPI0030C88DA7